MESKIGLLVHENERINGMLNDCNRELDRTRDHVRRLEPLEPEVNDLRNKNQILNQEKEKLGGIIADSRREIENLRRENDQLQRLKLVINE